MKKKRRRKLPRWALLALVWTVPSAVFVSAAAIAYSAYRIDPPARLDAAARAAVMEPLRAALRGQEAPCSARGAGDTVGVTVWIDGHQLARADGRGSDLCEATLAAAKAVRGNAQLRAIGPDVVERARIQADVITGHAPLGSGQWLVDSLALPGVGDALAINAGIEGVGADLDGRQVLVLPHELVATKLLATSTPSQQIPDFAMGVDHVRLASVIAARARVRVIPARSLFRFRSDAFVEPPAGTADRTPLQLTRGIPPVPPLSAQALRDAALLGGRYLVDHLQPNGRYVYEVDLATGSAPNPGRPDYSMPRHAGTTYFLAELYRITKQPWLREPIERAFAQLAELLAAGHCGGTLPDGTAYDCVLDRGDQVAELGSTALAVVALAEYQRATGDTRYAPLAAKLAAFVVYMQRPDGSFRHRFDARTKTPIEHEMLLYYSGEASLALARMFVVTGDARYAQAAERGLDWLVSWYDFFLGGFFYGEEHWTCIAAEAIWPTVQKDSYRAFCDGYAEFLRAQQPEVGEHPDEDDLVGAYGFTPFVAPYNTPAGSRTEAMISAYLLDLHHHAPDERIRGQIRAALQYVLGQQIRPDSDFSAAGNADGGIPASPTDRTVRIDYVQHVCSAMIRASEWIDTPSP